MVVGAGLAVLSAPVAATVAAAAGAYAIYQLASHAHDLKDMAVRIGSGRGTSDDWELLGDFVGGTVSGGAGASVGARVAAKLRPVALAGCRAGGCNIPGKSCFAAGTLIATAQGPLPIEAVTPGTLVWARNAETGAVGLQPVERQFVKEAEGLLLLDLEREDGARSRVETTPEHPFWVRDRGWLPAGELRSGDPVMALAGGWLRVGSSTWVRGRVTVYNFEVQTDHTYAVGALETWVHNSYEPSDSSGKKLPRFQGKKPKYHINETHVKHSAKYNPRKEPLPADAEEVYRNAVPMAEADGWVWFGKNEDGIIYRFSNSGNGAAHFRGRSQTKDGIRNSRGMRANG